MKFTAKDFLEALSRTTLSKERKKAILDNLEKFSFKEIETLFSLFKQNLKLQEETFSKIQSEDSLLDLKFELEFKQKIKTYS